MEIVQLTPITAMPLVPDLVALLQNVVNQGAAVSFLPPLAAADATAYWLEIIEALRKPHHLLFVAQQGTTVMGSVQLIMSRWPNGRYRAEVAKLLVHSAHRRAGVGYALMQALEAVALAAGKTTLVLDTRVGDAGEQLYLKLGFTPAGIIPQYALNADGTFHATVYMYKLLKPADRA